MRIIILYNVLADALKDEPQVGTSACHRPVFWPRGCYCPCSDNTKAARHGYRAPSTSFLRNLSRNGFCWDWVLKFCMWTLIYQVFLPCSCKFQKVLIWSRTLWARGGSPFYVPFQRLSFDVDTLKRPERQKHWQTMMGSAQSSALLLRPVVFSCGWSRRPSLRARLAPSREGFGGCVWVDTLGVWRLRPKMQINSRWDTGPPGAKVIQPLCQQ